MPETHNGALAKALLEAQRDMPPVEPDGVNPHFKSKFVTLGHLIAKVRPVLNKHGVSFAQLPSSDETGKPTLVTILTHESGERMEFAAPLLLPKNDPQGQGSAITYMRRYALASALGISDQEDDDGNAGSKEQVESLVSPDDVTLLAEQFKASGRSVDDLKLKLGSEGVAGEMTSVKQALSLLTPSQAAAVSAWMAK